MGVDTGYKRSFRSHLRQNPQPPNQVVLENLREPGIKKPGFPCFIQKLFLSLHNVKYN